METIVDKFCTALYDCSKVEEYFDALDASSLNWSSVVLIQLSLMELLLRALTGLEAIALEAPGDGYFRSLA